VRLIQDNKEGSRRNVKKFKSVSFDSCRIKSTFSAICYKELCHDKKCQDREGAAVRHSKKDHGRRTLLRCACERVNRERANGFQCSRTENTCIGVSGK